MVSDSLPEVSMLQLRSIVGGSRMTDLRLGSYTSNLYPTEAKVEEACSMLIIEAGC